MYAVALIFWKAIESLIYDGGLANAGNLALSLLLSLFPFMILLAAILNFWGEPELLTQILTLVFDHWPAGSARPIAEQMKVVLNQAKGQLLTLGNLIALILATNGIESARDGLNRAYNFDETRNYIWRRIQGSGFILGAVVALIFAALILVGTPVVWQFLGFKARLAGRIRVFGRSGAIWRGVLFALVRAVQLPLFSAKRRIEVYRCDLGYPCFDRGNHPWIDRLCLLPEEFCQLRQPLRRAGGDHDRYCVSVLFVGADFVRGRIQCGLAQMAGG